MVYDLLKKAKKPELVKFTKEVLGEKISTGEKKEVFLKAVSKRVWDKDIGVKKFIEHFGWDLKINDVIVELDDKLIYGALSTLSKKISNLYYEKSKAKTKEEKKVITTHIGKILGLRNDTILKLINLKKCSIVGTVNITSECMRTTPAYIDTVSGKELDVNKYMLFPNMKYCKAPKKGKSLDLNNINFLGEYKVENAKTIINRSYVVSVDGHDVLLPDSFKSKIIINFNDDELPIRAYETKEKSLTAPTKVDDVEYRKAIYVIHKFLDEEIKEAKKQKRLKELERKKLEREQRLARQKRFKAKAMADKKKNDKNNKSKTVVNKKESVGGKFGNSKNKGFNPKYKQRAKRNFKPKTSNEDKVKN